MKILCSLFFFLMLISVPSYSQEEATESALDSLLNIRISTASKFDQPMEQVPSSVTIISSEDIERYGFKTLDEIINTVQGFYTSYDRNYTYVGVRGFSRPTDYNNRILLLLDGHRLNENVYGSSALGTDFVLDLRLIDRIEIIRGPGSVLYGTGAMFSVINVLLKQPGSIEGMRVSGGVGSFGAKQLSARYGGSVSGYDIFVSGIMSRIAGDQIHIPEYDSVSTNYGVAENLDFDNSGGMTLTIVKDDVKVMGFIMTREKGVPTAPFGADFNNPNTKTFDQRKGVSVSYETKVSYDKMFTLHLAADRYDYNGIYPYSGKNAYDSDVGIWYHAEPRLQWDIAESDRLIIGAEFQHHSRVDYRYWDADTVFFDKNVPFSLGSIYCDNEYQLFENLLLRSGVRYDFFSQNLHSLNPRAAIVFNPMKNSAIKLLYGEAFRIPTLYEKYYDDAYSGFKSNTSIAPEKIKTLEFVAEHRMTREFFLSLSLYQYWMDDLIDTRLDPADLLKQFQNVSEVKAAGAEVSISGRHRSGFSEYLNYTFQQAKDERGKLLTNQPEHMLKGGVSYLVTSELTCSVWGRYETKRRTVQNSFTGSTLLLNAFASYQILGTTVEASVQVTNILNARYGTPGGFEHRPAEIIQDGRSIYLRVDYRPW